MRLRWLWWRKAAVEVEEEADDLVRGFEVALKRRRTGEVVRLKVSKNAPVELRSLIMRSLDLNQYEVIEVDGMIGLSDLKELANVPRKDLLWAPFTPRIPERVLDHDGDILKSIKQKDMLLHHPYETFENTGERQWSPGYNPKPLIAKSVRSLAQQITKRKNCKNL